MPDAPDVPSGIGSAYAPESYLPHLPPWIFVDRIDSIDPPNSIQATRTIAEGDPFVRAHFAGKGRIFPGVLLIEMVGQVATLLQTVFEREQLPQRSALSLPEAHLLARCKASFHSPARIGDVLTVRVGRQDTVGSTSLFRGIVTCGERAVCTVELLGAAAKI